MNTPFGTRSTANSQPAPYLQLPRQLPPMRGPGVNLRGIAITAPATGPVLVSLVVGCGQLILNCFQGLAFLVGSGKGDSHMCFYGSPEAVNAALDGMVYRPRPGFRGQDTLALAVSVPGGGEAAVGQATSAQLSIEVQPAAPMDGAGLDSDEVCQWFMSMGQPHRQTYH